MHINSQFSILNCPTAMLKELIELMGQKAALQLIAAMGGVVITVPRWRDDPAYGSWLGRIVHACGAPAAKRLCDTFAGEQVAIPVGRPLRASEIEAKVRNMRTQGRYVNDIALAVGITSRRVFQILRGARREAESAQRSLFGG